MFPPGVSISGEAASEGMEPGVAAPITEVAADLGGVPLFVHPVWQARFPWLVQGVTGRGQEDAGFDLALFGAGEPSAVLERWWTLGRATRVSRLVHGHQVHGAAVALHREAAPGLHVSPATDGHATLQTGVLLSVSVADCVPISLVAPARRAVALLHAGWRGVAADILEECLERLRTRMAVESSDLYAHLGPSICGRCYEVGPEVHRALGLREPPRPAPVDLRAVLAGRMARAGIVSTRVTASTYCTRCGDTPFFSHRRGDLERQVAVLGISSDPE